MVNFARGMIAALILSAGIAVSANAAIVKYAIDGELTQVDAPLGGLYQLGQAFSGTFSVDDTADVEFQQTGIRFYRNAGHLDVILQATNGPVLFTDNLNSQFVQTVVADELETFDRTTGISQGFGDGFGLQLLYIIGALPPPEANIPGLSLWVAGVFAENRSPDLAGLNNVIDGVDIPADLRGVFGLADNPVFSIFYGDALGSYSAAGTITSIRQITDSVPEPATLALFGLGVVGLAGLRRLVDIRGGRAN